MEIKITKAAENNLKDFSVAIPVNRMTAITGISGSGKSSLLKNVLASEGAQRYSCMFSRAATSSLASSKHVRVQNIENLPLTLLVDTKCSITNSMSTVSTVSGLHEALRSLFVDFGETICPRCNTRQEREGRIPSRLLAEIVCDDRYDRALDYLRAIGSDLQNIRLVCRRRRRPWHGLTDHGHVRKRRRWDNGRLARCRRLHLHRPRHQLVKDGRIGWRRLRRAKSRQRKKTNRDQMRRYSCLSGIVHSFTVSSRCGN